MKIVFLDRKTIGDDLDLTKFEDFGQVVMYGFSTPEEVPERVADADVIILNKVPVNERTVGKARNLKLVCVTATGTDNLDKEYLEKRGSPGGMWPATLRIPWPSTRLPCSFICMRSWLTMMIM